MAGRNIDVVLDGLIGGGFVSHDHGGQLAGGIAEDVDVVAVGGSVESAWRGSTMRP